MIIIMHCTTPGTAHFTCCVLAATLSPIGITEVHFVYDFHAQRTGESVLLDPLRLYIIVFGKYLLRANRSNYRVGY
jgi:hypothetical protein